MITRICSRSWTPRPSLLVCTSVPPQLRRPGLMMFVFWQMTINLIKLAQPPPEEDLPPPEPAEDPELLRQLDEMDPIKPADGANANSR